MADEIHKFNRGDAAEGILGAALVAKFANRPKSLKDKNAPITVEMIDHVLDEFFKVNGSDEGSLGNEFEFNKEIVKDKITNEEYTLILINEE